MPVEPTTPAALMSVPFRGTRAVAAGLLTREQLRSSCWRRVFRDVYVSNGTALDISVRAAAAGLLLPDGAVLSGTSAAWMHDVDIRGRAEPVEATIPRGTRWSSRRGLRVREALLPLDDIGRVAGVPVTTPLRTAFDLARRPPLVEGVVATDALGRAGLVKPDELAAYAASTEHRGWRGVRAVPEVVRLCDPRAESPMESRLRLVVVLAGLPVPDVQVEVFDARGVFLGRVDLGYRCQRLGLEFDGRHHREDAAYLADVRRQNRLRAHGWTLLRFTAEDVYRRPGLVVAQVRAALASS